MNNYRRISDFGSNMVSEANDPLTYCVNNQMDQRFLHGGHADTRGQYSRSCQLYMSEYCANKWDMACEVAAGDLQKSYPNQVAGLGLGSAGGMACRGLTAGEELVANTAARKYLHKMHGAKLKYEPFDPNVSTSPMISYWVGDCDTACEMVPEFIVDPKTIDSDPVMDKLLARPIIGINILTNIYNTMKRYGTLAQLKGTKLGNFYNHNRYFRSKGGV